MKGRVNSEPQYGLVQLHGKKITHDGNKRRTGRVQKLEHLQATQIAWSRWRNLCRYHEARVHEYGESRSLKRSIILFKQTNGFSFYFAAGIDPSQDLFSTGIEYVIRLYKYRPEPVRYWDSEEFNWRLTLTLRRSRTGTVWFYTSTSNKRVARPKLYTKSLTGDLKLMYSRLTLVRISINL